MATLILSTAGGAVAGPIGAAVGTLVGREIDKSFRGGGKRQRLTDLRVQASQYGGDVPGVHGRMRVAGTVIWATDLVENALVTKSGAKHAFSVNFALALSSRRLESVHRIWADGRLIRGEAGDHKTSYTMRFLAGSEDQAADGLISSVEGSEATPGYRGVALLVFEDFDLSTFGNHLPQITVEVDAADGPTSVPELLAKMIGVGSGGEPALSLVAGYAVQGDDMASAASPLIEAGGARFAHRSGAWAVDSAPAIHDIGVHEMRELNTRILDRSEPPTKVSIRYFDTALDYAAGEQSAKVPSPSRHRLERIDVPAALSGSQAKAFAQKILADRWVERRTTEITLPVSRCDIAVGDCVKLPDRTGADLFVSRKELRAGKLRLTLVERARDSAQPRASSGRMLSQQDIAPTPLQVALFELPPGSTEPNRAGVGIIVAGGAVPWRAVPIHLSANGLSDEVSSSTLPGVIGKLVAPLAAASPYLFDLASEIVVNVGSDTWLTPVSDDALLGGANLALVGDEYLQFAQAEPIDSGIFRLTKLIRGRFGSTSDNSHATGARFLLLDRQHMSELVLPFEASGCVVKADVFGLNGESESAEHLFEARVRRPLSPVRPSWQRDNAGLRLKWVRRSRSGNGWRDSIEAPIGETQERYRVLIFDPLGSSIEREVSTVEIEVTQAELAGLGSALWHVEICQIGDFAISAPLKFDVN